jgi:hypothetical protein
VSCNTTSNAAFPKITPVEPPNVNIIRKIKGNIIELEIVTSLDDLIPRIVQSQLNNFVAVGREIIMVIAVK